MAIESSSFRALKFADAVRSPSFAVADKDGVRVVSLKTGETIEPL